MIFFEYFVFIFISKFETFQNYLNFEFPDYYRHKTYSKVFKVTLLITKKEDNECFEQYVVDSPSVKEGRKNAQIKFLNKTCLVNPKELPKNSELTIK